MWSSLARPMNGIPSSFWNTAQHWEIYKGKEDILRHYNWVNLYPPLGDLVLHDHSGLSNLSWAVIPIYLEATAAVEIMPENQSSLVHTLFTGFRLNHTTLFQFFSSTSSITNACFHTWHNTISSDGTHRDCCQHGLQKKKTPPVTVEI